MAAADINNQIKAYRLERFKRDMEEHWDVDDVLFNVCFLFAEGASDNIAKNFYPYSFGGKWRLRNDDMDTIKPTDNQGADRKPYWLEWMDKDANGNYYVNAAEGGFIKLIWDAYFTGPGSRGYTMMHRVLQGLEQLGGSTTGMHLDRLMAWNEKYFNKVKDYFPAMLVNDDMMRYERARIAANKGLYSEVDPLTQELGDHKSTENAWMKKRFVYLQSMFSYGDFAAGASGTITFRLLNASTFTLTPAIAMYPSIAAGSTVVRGARTMEGETCSLYVNGSDLDCSVLGAHYLSDIGDWHNVPIRNNPSFNARMLKELVLGTPNATDPISIDITGLTVNCLSLRKLDVRNIRNLTGQIDLSGSTIIKTVLAEGTQVSRFSFADGSPLETLNLPEAYQQIVLKNMPVLTNDNINYMDCAQNVTRFLVSECPGLSPLTMLSNIIEAQKGQGENHALKRVYVDGFNEVSDDPAVLDALIALMDGYQAISRQEGDISGLPILSGTITMTCPVYEDTVQMLQEAFGAGGLVINYSSVYVRFEDSRVHEICAYNWGETYDLQELDDKDRPMVGTFEEVLDSIPVQTNTVIKTDDGTEASSTGRCASDYIDISDYADIKCSVALSNCVYYNSSKAYLSEAVLTTSYAAIPEGAAYIRVSGYDADMDNAVLTGKGTNNKTVGGHGGVLGTGTLEGGQEDGYMYSDYYFACSTAIGKHGDVPATAARTVKYRIEWEVSGATPTLEGAPWGIPAQSATTNSCLWVGQYTSAMAATALMSITAENWESSEFWADQTSIISDGDGKFHTIVTCTNTCQYLRLMLRAVAGVTVKYKIVSIGVTKLPSGITSGQCAAVTSLSNKFASNNLIEFFNEGKYFTNCTTLNSSEFQYCSKLKEVYMGYALNTAASERYHPFHSCGSLYKVNLRSMAWVGYSGSINANRSMFYHCYALKRLVLPNTTNARMLADDGPSLTMYDIGSKLVNINLRCINTSTGVLVLRGAPPSIQSTNTIPARIYVHSEYLEQYKKATGWVNYATKIFAIGGAEWVAEFGSADEYANLTEQEYADTYGWLEEQEQG